MAAESSCDNNKCLFPEARLIRAQVVPGARRGGLLGFPTANLSIDPRELPPCGIYAVWVRIPDEGGWMGGAASVGFNPTYELRAPQMEVHILDYAGASLYGKTLEVLPAAYLREERRYDSSEELIRQMEQDRENARLALAQCPVPRSFPTVCGSPTPPGHSP